MTEPQKGKNAETSRRDDRRAKALRENLKRRKAQTKERAAAAEAGPEAEGFGEFGPETGDSGVR